MAYPAADGQVRVIGGVDTHRDTHTAAAIDQTGRVLGHAAFTADAAGYRQLTAWLAGFGSVVLVGVEGTGSYGVGLARHLRTEDIPMVEVDRPDRKARRRVGKSDPLDAEAAARAALSRAATATPKVRDGRVESLRVLRVTRRSAVQARAECMVRLKALIVTADDHLRQDLRQLTDARLIRACARLRPNPAEVGDPAQATKTALRALARRHATLTEEITALDALIVPLTQAINPRLTHLPGVGTDTAGQMLVTAGDNTERLRSEAAFAMLCGTAPIPASSGQRTRFRLNRGGDRQANAALHRVALTRMRWHPATRAYVERRTTEGLSKRDIIRCLKRYIAREIYQALQPPQTRSNPPALTT